MNARHVFAARAIRPRSLPAAAPLRELAAFPWAIYLQDRDTVGHLFKMMREPGAEPPRIAGSPGRPRRAIVLAHAAGRCEPPP